jgi:hypothetical protein
MTSLLWLVSNNLALTLTLTLSHSPRACILVISLLCLSPWLSVPTLTPRVDGRGLQAPVNLWAVVEDDFLLLTCPAGSHGSSKSQELLSPELPTDGALSGSAPWEEFKGLQNNQSTPYFTKIHSGKLSWASSLDTNEKNFHGHKVHKKSPKHGSGLTLGTPELS